MDQVVLDQLRRLAVRVAWDWEDVEDLMQQGAIGLHRKGLEGWSGLAATVAHRDMVDWQRLRYGRVGSARSNAKWRATSFGISEHLHALKWTEVEFKRVEDREFLRSLAWWRLSHRDIEMWEMRANGATLSEIGVEFGVSESRVCQVFAKTRKRLLGLPLSGV